MSGLRARAAGVVLVGALLVAACTGSEGERATHVDTDRGSADLEAPPFVPGPQAGVHGVADRWLVLVDGTRVAAYDFADRGWTRLPDAPLKPRAMLTVGPAVVLIGARCGDDCPGDVKRQVVAASYRVADGSGTWRVRELPVPEWEPAELGVQVAGEHDGETILAGFGGVYAIDARLRVRELPEPEMPEHVLYPWLTCLTSDGAQALVTSADHLNDGVSLAGNLQVGRTGNLAVSTATPTAWKWATVPGSGTAVIDGETGEGVTSRTCLSDGILITTPTRAFAWRYRGWHRLPAPPLFTAVASSPVRMSSGAIVMHASGGRLSVLDRDRWASIAAVPDVGPQQLADMRLAAVGDRVVVLAFAPPERTAGALHEVQVPAGATPP